MIDKKQWTEQTDQLLKYLYQDLKVFNWGLISKQISQRQQLLVNADQCRIRYQEKFGPVLRDEWTPQQEKELYRLHNQNGNRWAVIALNLLGRNDNCVKNHFYSKLRKSLRTINKIAKLHLRKQAKQISDVVIYKLTEATDQSLKQNSQIPKQTIAMCYQLKNKLLQYQMDQKDIKQNLDYRSQKELLHGLAEFNKIYKKKSKKQKITILGSENLKKKKQKNKNNSRKINNDTPQSSEISQDQYYQQEQQKKKEEPIKPIEKKKTSSRIQQIYKNNNEKMYQSYRKQKDEEYNPPRSQSDYSQSVHKRRVNFLIKAPSKQEKDNYEKNIEGISCQPKIMKKQTEYNHPNPLTPQLVVPSKPKNRIQDILKAQGILQNGLYGNQNYFRRQNSARSFSICSESSNMDMFGQDLGFTGFKQLSEMENQCHIFKTQKDQ